MISSPFISNKIPTQGFVLRLLTVVHSAAPTPTPQEQPAATDPDSRTLQTVFIQPATGTVPTAMNNIKLVTTIKSFKEQYCAKRSSDPDHCRLIFSGKQLEEIRGEKVMTLKDYNVQNVSLFFSIEGEGREC
jgi:hypothetical protein